MNPRIRELVKQSGGDFWQRIESDGVLNKEAYITFDPPESLEKFAELIVAECVQTLIDNTPELYTNEAAEEDWDKGYDRAMKDCVHHIQEHFGVEE